LLKKTFTYLIIFSIDLSLESVDLRISFFDQILKLEHSGLVVLDLVSGVFSFVLESRYLVCGSNELDFAVVQFSNQFGVRSFLQKKACNINGCILKQFKFHQRVELLIAPLLLFKQSTKSGNCFYFLTIFLCLICLIWNNFFGLKAHKIYSIPYSDESIRLS